MNLHPHSYSCSCLYFTEWWHLYHLSQNLTGTPDSSLSLSHYVLLMLTLSFSLQPPPLPLPWFKSLLFFKQASVSSSTLQSFLTTLFTIDYSIISLLIYSLYWHQSWISKCKLDPVIWTSGKPTKASGCHPFFIDASWYEFCKPLSTSLLTSIQTTYVLFPLN